MNKQEIPFGNIWYHKKNAITNSLQYTIKLQLNDLEVKGFLKKYISGQMSFQNILEQIREKEKEAGSLGIIWHLLQYFEPYIKEDKNKPYYILNSLEHIEVKEGFLILEGRINNTVPK